ncbi:MAG: DUF4905 domain-containing protein, partial [Bernardetiaceae bacterium]|nr:DUF4905 domain-containing protein [Bernardetiaceae bacterium]
MPSALLRVFDTETPGQVFRLVADAQRAWLAWETRQAAQREVSFSVLALPYPGQPAAQLLVNNLGIDEPWFCGLSALAGGRLFLHRLANSTHPDPRGIVAVDVATPTWLWEQPDLYLETALPAHVLAYGFGPAGKQPQWLAAATGLTCAPPAEQVSTAPAPGPACYLPGSPEHETVQQFMAQRLGVIIHGPVDYQETAHVVVLGCHHGPATGFTSEVVVLDQH